MSEGFEGLVTTALGVNESFGGRKIPSASANAKIQLVNPTNLQSSEQDGDAVCYTTNNYGTISTLDE